MLTGSAWVKGMLLRGEILRTLSPFQKMSAMTQYECTPHTGNIFGNGIVLPERSELRRATNTPSRLQQCTVLGAQLGCYWFLQYQYSNFFSLRLPFYFPTLFLVYAVFLIGLVSSCLKLFTCST